MLSQFEKVEAYTSRVDALRSKIMQQSENDIFSFSRFFECGLLKKLINECGLQYDDSEFIYSGSQCDRVDIWVLNYFDQTDKINLCVPSLSVIRNLKGFEVI